MIRELDDWMIAFMRRWGITLLRISIGIVYIWFGALKVFGVSPVAEMIHQTYSFFPDWFMMFLGIWEIFIGLGLIFRFMLRVTLGLMWLQIAGTFGSLILAPHLFFTGGNPFLLTSDGEFVIKNIVFIAAGIAIGGMEVPRRTVDNSGGSAIMER